MSSETMTVEQAEGEVRAARDAIVEAVLPNVAFDGWTMKAVAAAAADAGYPAGTAARLFPQGVIDVLRHLSDLSDRKMLAAMSGRDLGMVPLRERVALAVRARIEAYAPHKEAVRRAFSFLALPQNAGVAAGNIMRTVDALWYGAGDEATDFSYYTKRALLAPIYVATILYWLDDDSEDFVETWSFLDRRLGNVLQIPRLSAKLRTLVNPLSWLSGRGTGGDFGSSRSI